MQPIDYKTISPTWNVEQGDGDNVLRPVLPFSRNDYTYPIEHKEKHFSVSTKQGDIEKTGYASILLNTYRGISFPIFTSLQPGTYKAEDLPEASLQARKTFPWFMIGADEKDYYEQRGYTTRLYVPIPA